MGFIGQEPGGLNEQPSRDKASRNAFKTKAGFPPRRRGSPECGKRKRTGNRDGAAILIVDHEHASRRLCPGLGMFEGGNYCDGPR